MANRDIPSGFTKPMSKTGRPPYITPWKNTAVAVFKGDAVDFDGSGRVRSATGTPSTIIPDGVAINHRSATVNQTVFVYTQLEDLTFEVQCDDNTITDDTTIGISYDITCPTGNTTTLQSAHELDANSTNTGQARHTHLITRPDNDDTLTNNKVRIEFATIGVTAVVS